jgi:hypothetical protein
MRPSDDFSLPPLSPAERLHAVAAVLSVGLRRLRDARLQPPLSPPKKESESIADNLDLSGTSRLSVHTG